MIFSFLWPAVAFSMATCDWAPRPYEAVYDVFEDGKRRGSATATLRQDAGVWHYQLITHARRGLISGTLTETSTFRFDRGFHPLSFQSETSVAFFSREETVTFDESRAHGVYKGKKWSLPIDGNEVDRLTSTLLIGQILACRQPGQKAYAFPVSVMEKGRERIYELASSPPEEMASSAGPVSAIPVIRDRGKRKTTSFYAPSMHYIPILIEDEDDGEFRRLVLKALPEPPHDDG